MNAAWLEMIFVVDIWPFRPEDLDASKCMEGSGRMAPRPMIRIGTFGRRAGSWCVPMRMPATRHPRSSPGGGSFFRHGASELLLETTSVRMPRSLLAALRVAGYV